jgi:thiamine-phosphate pyrophosphorylase
MADRCLLYYITDRSQFYGDESTRRHAVLAKISEAAAAGVDYIQLREKDLSAKKLEVLARDALMAVCDSTPIEMANRENRPCLLINSRTDIALAVGAGGIHLRSDDVLPNDIRRVVAGYAHRPPAAERFLVVASCHSVTDVSRAEAEEVDFAVFAPVFGKAATMAQPAGLEVLRQACQAKIAILALGGVTMENAFSCLNAGAAGVAGIRLFQENRIGDVVRKLRAL